MKKTFRILGMCMMAILLGLSCVACSDDDDDEPTVVEGEAVSLIGEWVSTGYDAEDDEYWYDYINLKKNGEFEWSSEYREDGYTETGSVWGTWKAENSKLYLTVKGAQGDVDEDINTIIGQTIYFPYSLKNGKLTVDGEEYTRK